MGDVGDFWRDVKKDWKAEGQARRWNNLENGERTLLGKKIPFEKKSPYHFVVGEKIDYWPSTGKYIVRSSQKKGRGLMNLIREYENLVALESL